MSPHPASRPSGALPALQLEPERIVETIGRLSRRIEERFPGSGLSTLAEQLDAIGRETRAHVDEIARPIWWLRIATGLMLGLVVLGLAAAIWAVRVEIPAGFDTALDAIQVFESGIQDAVFIGFGVAFLVTAENRLRRRSALAFLRELRAIAHIVDMHQLTKDPDRLTDRLEKTASSPERTLTREELGRYLDYCSEMLSLTSKLAALYAARVDDSVVLQAVDEVEALTSGLSNKIWQKIMMLESTPGSGG